jgi:hypothetical protein
VEIKELAKGDGKADGGEGKKRGRGKEKAKAEERGAS